MGLDPKIFIEDVSGEKNEYVYSQLLPSLESLVWLCDWKQIGFFVEKDLLITCNPCRNNHCRIDSIPQKTTGISFSKKGDQIGILDEVDYLIKEVDQQYDVVLLEPKNSIDNRLALNVAPDAISLYDAKVYLFTLDEEVDELNLHTAMVKQAASTHQFNKQRALQISVESASQIEEEISVGTPIFCKKEDEYMVVGILNKSRPSKNECLAKPSNIILECLNNSEDSSDDLFSTETISAEELVQVFAQSEIAYREASSLGIFATKETVEKEARKNTQLRNAALTKWFEQNDKCIRFIYKTDVSSGAKHMIGLTCVLPLCPEEYEKYKEGKIKEYDLSIRSDFSCIDNAEGYFCFQSFVYCGKMRGENIPIILKKSIIEHIMDMSINFAQIYCIAEIGTMAGDHIAKLFEGGIEVGLSLERRPLREWIFDVTEVKNLV